MKPRFVELAAVIVAMWGYAAPAGAGDADPAACPPVVRHAIDTAFPKATITKCRAEHEHGHDQFEVRVTKSDRSRAEVDVSPDGRILQIEERIAIDKVPVVVMKAFAAKYPKAKADTAEKQTPSSGPVSYELGFSVDASRREATFTETGKFVEEE